VLSKPPVETMRHGEALVLNGFSAFSLAAPLGDLSAALAAAIPVEVWSKERYAKDKLLAVARLPLWAPLEQAPARPRDGGEPLHSWEGVVTAYELDPAVAPEVEARGAGAVELRTTGRKMHALRVALTFQDSGAAPAEATHRPASYVAVGPAAAPESAQESDEDDADGLREGGSVDRSADERFAHETRPHDQSLHEHMSLLVEASAHEQTHAAEPEARAARSGMADGEAWEARMRAREQARLAALEQEFRRQEHARQHTVTKRLSELAGLEQALKTALFEVERRERRLVIAEEEADSRRRREQAALEQKRAELQEAKKRMQADAAHQAAAADARCKVAQEQAAALQQRLRESEERNGRLDAEVHKAKSATRNTSEPQLMVEAAQLRARNEDLEGRLARTEAAHQSCKEQLAKALARLARIKEEEHTRELDQMRLLLRARTGPPCPAPPGAVLAPCRRSLGLLAG